MNILTNPNIDMKNKINFIASSIEEYIELTKISDTPQLDVLSQKVNDIKDLMSSLVKAEGQENFALNKNFMNKKTEIDAKIKKFGPDFSSIMGSVINSLAKGFNSRENNQQNALNSFKEEVQLIKEVRQDGQELRESINLKTSQRDEFLKNAPIIIAKLKEKDENNKAAEVINLFDFFTRDLAFSYSHTTMLQSTINHAQDGINKLLKLRVAVLLADAIEPGKYGSEIDESVQDLREVDNLLSQQVTQRNIEQAGLKEGLKSMLENKITQHRSDSDTLDSVQTYSSPKL